ncbi:MAG: hypothetical protein QGG09_02650 [Pirellulaceae bacterium]|nr:hypothetical protein [Pirellulaceae bacterium]
MMVRLTVRAAGVGISWTVNEWTVLVAMGALSAEPETREDFLIAVRRYQPNHRWEDSGQTATEMASMTGDDGWCLIDLDSRSVVAGGEFTLPEEGGAFQAGDDEPGDGFPIVWLDTPAEWSFQPGGDDWRSAIEERRESFENYQHIASRAILYGHPMLEFIANRVLGGTAEDAGDDNRYVSIREIHADWLMTTRQDLLGHSPRTVLLCHRNQIDQDIQHRSEQWSMQGFAPLALNVNSAAYLFGGYGTTEVALYFDLMRSLLDEAWDRVIGGESSCDLLVERLAEYRDQWLAQPPKDGSCGQSCHELIESERQRMPVTSDGMELDCDCPICQAEADGAFGDGPMFMVIDGHHLELEDEFAFSMTESREAWEREQAEFRCFSEEMDCLQAEQEALGDELDSVWMTSSVDWDSILATGCPPLSAKLAIGFPLAELVTELQERATDSSSTDALNAAFSTFRRADDSVAEQSAAEDLRACLEQIAETYPELVAGSADLQSRLDEVMRSSERSSH